MGRTMGQQKKSTATVAAPAPLDFHTSRQQLSGETFYRFCREYPNHEATAIYVYRVKPQINRKLAGISDSNIGIVPGGGKVEVDSEYLLRTYGSGVYHLKFTDGNKPRGLTEVARTSVEIWDPAVPPILNPVELVVSAKANDAIVQQYIAEGWQVIDGKMVPPANGGDVAKGFADMAERLARPAVPSVVNSASEKLIDKALDSLMNRKPEEEFDRALKLSERLRPQTDKNQVELMGLMLELVKDRAAGRPAETNAVSQMRETMGLLKEFGLSPSSGGGGGGGWMDAVKALPAILQFGAQIVHELTVQRQMEVARLGAAGGAAAPAAVAAGVGGVPVGGAAPAAPGGVPVNGVVGADMDIFGKLGFNLAEFRAIGEDALEAFLNDVPGEQFAASVCTCRKNGQKLYDAMAQFDNSQIMGFLEMVPGDVRSRVAGREKELESWLDDFLGVTEGDAGAGAGAA